MTNDKEDESDRRAQCGTAAAESIVQCTPATNCNPFQRGGLNHRDTEGAHRRGRTDPNVSESRGHPFNSKWSSCDRTSEGPFSVHPLCPLCLCGSIQSLKSTRSPTWTGFAHAGVRRARSKECNAEGTEALIGVGSANRSLRSIRRSIEYSSAVSAFCRETPWRRSQSISSLSFVLCHSFPVTSVESKAVPQCPSPPCVADTLSPEGEPYATPR